MNILFLTMSSHMDNIETSGIYTDLIRKFRDEGHFVYILYPRERRLGLQTDITDKKGIKALGVKTLNITKSNLIEKGIGQILLEGQFKRALKKYFQGVSFDLILYSTPPITFTKVIKFAKENNPNALSYLLLKDIFPQNAVDLGMLSISGLKGLLYKYFRRKEKKLYQISDYIGCMSPANVRYLLEHNPEISLSRVEIAPNSYDIPTVINKSADDYNSIKNKYKLPLNKPIFIYGGNMGKPQGISFLIECLESVKDREDCYFVIVGNGTEYAKLEEWFEWNNPQSVSLYKHIPKEDYDLLVSTCDIGLIFLDYRFSIPNYPSRLLPYLMSSMPIIAVTDLNSDVGTLAEEYGYGYWCPSNSVEAFIDVVNKILVSDLKDMGEKGYKFYLNNYTTEHTFRAIIKHLK